MVVGWRKREVARWISEGHVDNQSLVEGVARDLFLFRLAWRTPHDMAILKERHHFLFLFPLYIHCFEELLEPPNSRLIHYLCFSFGNLPGKNI